MLNGYRRLQRINKLGRGDRISSTSRWWSLRMHRYITKPGPYADVRQFFSRVPDFLSGAKCAIFLLSVVLAAKIPCSVVKEVVSARSAVTRSVWAGSSTSAFFLLILPLAPGSEASCFWRAHEFWTPAEFLWWKRLWKSEGKQVLILAFHYAQLAYLCPVFPVSLPPFFLVQVTDFVPDVGDYPAPRCGQVVWTFMVVMLSKATLLQTEPGFLVYGFPCTTLIAK